ncbi:uncharacterized protein MELLADRAFT_106902 [Melampsora larici-populina 98AG31]|uniref:Uncharacterized protein n=1 Tax=Melampsora larici-populina (strain 98AG31 / pathotype 3-4-7) TaxID=747676 RepID=F4RN08_MELLP|nr:uncharacterized protein MELLADRAFT_106902 [Melampsora larici-populina 98AG31]EGG06216.1 hypothetical protein MELLADRAFT_106902 [Melampsora larici-populina 98AG31]
MPIVPRSINQRAAHPCSVTAERMSPYSRGPSQNSRSPSLALSLRALNDHVSLPNASASMSTLDIGHNATNSLARRASVPVMRESPSRSSQSIPNDLGTTSTPFGLSQPASQRDQEDHSRSEITPRLTAAEQAFMQGLCTELGLDAHHQEYVQSLAQSNQVVGPGHRHIAVIASNMGLLMEVTQLAETVTGLADTVRGLRDTVQVLTEEIRTPALVGAGAAPAPVAGAPTPASAAPLSTIESDATTPWQASPMLLKAITQLADKKATLPLIEGYTAIKGANGVWLTDSLFNTVKLEIARKSAAWKHEHLPRKLQGISDSLGVKRYHSDIKNGCKHAREKLHISVLSGVYDSKAGVITGKPVPDLPELVSIIAQKCGTTGHHTNPESLWEATDQPTRARVAYLVSKFNIIALYITEPESVVYVPPMKRREALRIFQNGKGSSSIWATVDSQLEQLRLEERNRISNDGYTAGDYTASVFFYVIFAIVNCGFYFEALTGCAPRLQTGLRVDRADITGDRLQTPIGRLKTALRLGIEVARNGLLDGRASDGFAMRSRSRSPDHLRSRSADRPNPPVV